MREFIKQKWARFRSDVPTAEHKAQLVLVNAVKAFGAISAISFGGKFQVIGIIAATGASFCGVAIAVLQFADDTHRVLHDSTGKTTLAPAEEVVNA